MASDGEGHCGKNSVGGRLHRDGLCVVGGDVGYQRNAPKVCVHASPPAKDGTARDCHLCIVCIVDV